MDRLKITKAIYYNHKGDISQGQEVTRELSELIKDNKLIYSGRYNDIFKPDPFPGKSKDLKVELKLGIFGIKKHFQIYREDQIIRLPEDLNIKRSWINNPWLVTIVGGVIVGVILLIVALIFFKQPTFLYNQTDNSNQNNINIDDIIFGDQINQEHAGSGDNVAGDKIINNVRTEASATDKRILFEGDIYELPKEADQFTTTIDKSNHFKDFEGLVVESVGFITDINEPAMNFFGAGPAVIVYHVRIDNTEDKDGPNILCAFDESWGQKLETLNVPYESQYSGIIAEVRLSGAVLLDKCQLK